MKTGFSFTIKLLLITYAGHTRITSILTNGLFYLQDEKQFQLQIRYVRADKAHNIML